VVSERDILAGDRQRIEGDFRAHMTAEELALVDEFDELDAQRLAGVLPEEKQTRWFLLANAQDGIWYRAAMARFPEFQR
jgi:hypothetical protein